MRFLKKLLSFCLVLCLCAATPAVVQTAAVEEESYYTDVLLALGIYDIDDQMDLYNAEISREELAALISVFYGVSEQSSLSATPFDDVPENWASGHIMAVVENGLMNGYDDGLFRPGRFVTGSEVLKVLVKMVGYDVLAESKGGYPNGYFSVADKLGILKGVNMSDWSAVLTRKDFTRLLYNAIHVDILEQTVVGAKNEYDSQKGKNLLSERLDIYEIDGNLAGVFGTTVDFGTVPGKNRVRIDSTVYACNFNAYPYLGMNVEGYYQQALLDDIGEVLYLEADDVNQNVISVDSDSITSLTDKELTYEENDRIKRAVIPNDVIVVFNGKRDTYQTVSSLKPKQGEVKMIDADRDGSYEYLIINSFMTYFVDTVSEVEGKYTFTDKTGKLPLIIDTVSDDVFATAIDKDRVIELREIEERDVLTVMTDSIDLDKMQAKDDSTVFTIYRFNNRFTGRLTSIATDEIYIDDAPYELAADYNSKKYPLTVGNEYTFYLDYAGRVCVAEAGATSERYGILQAYDLSGSLAQTCRLKIFDQDGKFVTYGCTKQVSLDGTRQNDLTKVITYLQSASVTFAEQTGIANVPENGIWQLVRYTVGADGNLSKIDTVLPDANGSDEALTYSGCVSAAASSTWQDATMVIKQNKLDSESTVKIFGMETETIIFQVGNDKTNVEKYGIQPVSRMQTQNTDMKFFDGGSMNVCKVAIQCTDEVAKVYLQEYKNLMILEKVTEMVGADGEVSPHMIGTLLDSGQKAEVALESKTQLTDEGIKPGDFVQWQPDADGVAVDVVRAFGSEDGVDMRHGGSEWPGNTFTWVLHLTRSKAVAKNDNRLKMRLIYTKDSALEYEEPCSLKYLKRVYIWNSARQTLSPATIGDIRTEESYGASAADTLMCYYNSGQLRTIIIKR